MAALCLEWLSHEEFRAHITIPITPLPSLHNRALLFSLQEFIDWRQLGKINFGDGELPSCLAKFMKARACSYSSLADTMRCGSTIEVAQNALTAANSGGILPWLWLSNYCGGFMAGSLGRAELLMKSAQLGMTGLVLLDPEVCLSTPEQSLFLLAELGMGQGQEHIVKGRTSIGQGDGSFQGGDRAGRVTGAVEGKAQSVPVGGTFRICLGRLAYQAQRHERIGHVGISFVE